MPLLVAVRDLIFRSRIEEAARRAGVAVRIAPRDLPLEEAIRALGAGTVLADLNQKGALKALEAAAAGGAVRAVGYLGHLQEDLAAAAEAAGILVLTRGQLAARLEALVASAGEPSGPGAAGA
jgi:hypothetical protein